MYVDKTDEQEKLVHIPRGYRLLAFGKYLTIEGEVLDEDLYFAFLTRDDTLILNGQKIAEVVYAEGRAKGTTEDNSFNIRSEEEVTAFRNANNTYSFLISNDHVQDLQIFSIQDPAKGMSIHDGEEIVILFYCA